MNKFLLQHKYIANDEEFNYYKHECGLELLFVKTNDDNNTFCAKFDTVPNNDNGIPHILEHIILCGSEKYPIDDPFNELVKGTLFTYLNAITYCDKTIYPVSSRNKSEFQKMYKVYLDAVFAPFLSEQSFIKEGVRETKTGHSGIVYNEMSSAYNDIETKINYLLAKELYGETNYGFDSGGNPESIVNATHEEVLAFYKENYSKSNALLYFYGDLDIDNILNYIEETYLKNQEKEQSNKKTFIKNNKIISKTIELEKESDVNYYAISYDIDRVVEDNPYYLDELCILFDFLLESDTSLLTSFLKEKYDLIDVSYDFETDTLYPNLSIILKSENEIEGNELIADTINEFLVSEMKKGLDKVELESLAHLTNFKYTYENFGYKSKGLSYFLDILSVYQYEDRRDYIHLAKNLDFEQLFDKIKINHFEKLLECSIINCRNRVYLEIKQIEKDEEIEEKCEEAYKYESILEYSDKFIQPINLSEIESFQNVEFTECSIANKKVYFTKNDNKEISFLTLAFKVTDFSELGIYLELIGENCTTKNSKKEIKIKLDKYVGDMSVSFESILTRDKNFENYVVFELKFLNKYTKEALDSIEEVINYTLFDDIDGNRAKINELILDYDEEYASDNVRLGLLYANRYISEKFYNKDLVEGNFFYDSLNRYKAEQYYDFSKFNNGAKSFNDLTVFVATSDFEKFENVLSGFLKQIETGNNNKIYIKNEKPKNFVINQNSQTYTNLKVGTVDNAQYSGVCEVFSSIIKNEHFSDKIRLQGGAYGYDMSFDYDMNFYMYSMDDPNSVRTLKVFDEASDYVLKKSFTEKEIHNHVIGAVNSFDNFRSFYDKYYLFVLSKLKNDENDFFVKCKTEMLCTNSTEIKEFAEYFKSNVTKLKVFSFGKNLDVEKSL